MLSDMLRSLARSCYTTFAVQSIRASILFHVSYREMASSSLQTQDGSSGAIQWSFAFGSNMDIVTLQSKKGVTVLSSYPASLNGYKLSFSIRAMKYVEPAFAALEKGDEEDSVHGIAFSFPKDQLKILDAVERGYDKEIVHTLVPYVADAEKKSLAQDAFIYVRKPVEVTTDVSSEALEDVRKESVKLEEELYRPSKRYLSLLIRGAVAAGLKEEYIQSLRKVPTYQTSPEIRQRREKFFAEATSLPRRSRIELAEDASSTPLVSICGYIIKPGSGKSIWFKEHVGRDITFRQLRHFHGLPLDANDDLGCPPYPVLSGLTALEREYLYQWLDFYLFFVGEGEGGGALALHEEFMKTQEGGESEWQHPLP